MSSKKQQSTVTNTSSSTASKTNVTRKRDGYWACPWCKNLNPDTQVECTSSKATLIIKPNGKGFSKVWEYERCQYAL